MAKSRSFTRFTPAAGVLSGSIHERAMFRSGAEAGTLKLHPRLTPVVTLSFSIKVVFNAFLRSTLPHPSWSLGVDSPAPFVAELY